jgi:hypothetical protein
LSWQAARREAQTIVDRLQLKNSEINGMKVDLEAIFFPPGHVMAGFTG